MKNADVLTSLETDMYRGLSEREAERRRRKYGANGIWHVKRMSAFTAVCESLFDISTLLLIISATAAALFDESGTAFTVAILLVIAGVLRSVVYIRANRILEDMAQGFIPVATVIRDGHMKLLSAHDIVPGEIFFLEAGSTVPCDGRILAGNDSVVGERGITENNTPVHKFDTVIETDVQSGEVPCESRSNMLFAGSVVLSGNIRAVATACGMRSLIGMKQDGIEIEPSEKLPLIEKMESWCKITSLVMLACVMVITVPALFFRDGFTLPEIFLTTLAMAVAAMSEYLTVIGYIIIASAVHRSAGLGKKDAPKIAPKESYTRIRKPSVIENLAGIRRIVFCGSGFFESGKSEISAYRVHGGYFWRDGENSDTDGLKRMISYALSAFASGSAGRSLSSGISENKSERAKTVETAAGIFEKSNGGVSRFPVIDHVDSANVFAAGLDTSLIAEGNGAVAVSCGGIAEVLRVCETYMTNDGAEPLNTDIRKKIFTECAKLEYIGAKIVAVARVESEYTSLSRLAVIIQGMTFVGFFAVSEQAEADIGESISYIRENGIVPIVLSSSAERDLYYCHDIGLMSKKTKVVPYTEIDGVDFSTLSTDGMIVSFPEMKYGIPASAKADVMKKLMSGENVPITAAVGTDVSDVDVIRMSNVGIAVSASEYRPIPEPLSRVSAAVVYPELRTGRGGLSGVLRARRIAGEAVGNLGSAAFYITSAQIARLCAVLASVLIPTLPLLNETMILFWGLLFDFAAVLVMAFERDGGMRKSGKFTPVSFGRAAAVGGIWGVSPVILTLILKSVKSVRLGAGEDLTLFAGALLFCCPIVALEIMKKGSLFRHVRVNYASFGFFAAAISGILLMMLTNFGSARIGGKPCGVVSLFALIPAVIMLVVFEIYKKIGKQK